MVSQDVFFGGDSIELSEVTIELVDSSECCVCDEVVCVAEWGADTIGIGSDCLSRWGERVDELIAEIIDRLECLWDLVWSASKMIDRVVHDG